MRKPRLNPTQSFSSAPQQVRIIAGRWKGRKLSVIPLEGVRPTPNRVRETLFNWLQTSLPGSHCLDLFAGSGALGFEAVSRGAASACLIDNNAKVIELLHAEKLKFRATEVSLIQADGLKYIAQCDEPLDVLFLDPPFNKVDLYELLSKIQRLEILKPQAKIYVETERGQLPQELPPKWSWWRQSAASQVEFGLIATD